MQGKYDDQVTVPPTIEDATAVDDARKNINEYFKTKSAGRSSVKAKL